MPYNKKITPLIVRTEDGNLRLRKLAISRGLPERIYEDFGVYAHYMVPTIGLEEQLQWAWFHYSICNHYNNILFGKTRFLTMEIGPQVGKSLFTGLFISYVFGLLPNFSIMYATYNEDKAVDFTKKYLITPMGSTKYKEIFTHVSLKNELDKKDQTKKAQILRKTQLFTDTEFTISNALQNEAFGRFKAIGMEQGIHGRPANIFIIDDYVGKGMDTKSEIFREQRKKWFNTDMSSRLQGNNSIVVALCTRWYWDDLIGQFHQAYYDRLVPAFRSKRWEVPNLQIIKYRAEFRESDDNDPLDPRTKDGELLWEEHTLKYAFAKGDEEDFESLYNCDPSNSNDMEDRIKESDFGKWNHTNIPKNGVIYLVIDPAATSNKKSDKTSIQVWYVCGRKRYLIKLYYLQLDVLPLCDYVYNLLTVEYPSYHECIVEHASAGITLCQFLIKTKQMRGIIKMWFNGRPVDDVGKVKKSDQIKTDQMGKLSRYLRIMTEFRQPEILVYIPEEEIEHQKEFIRQLVKFTGEKGRKDDHADACVYLLLRTKGNIVPLRDNNNMWVNVDTSNKYRLSSNYGVKVI